MRPVICCSCGGRRWPGTGGEAQALLSRVGPSLNAGRAPQTAGPTPSPRSRDPAAGARDCLLEGLASAPHARPGPGSALRRAGAAGSGGPVPRQPPEREVLRHLDPCAGCRALPPSTRWGGGPAPARPRGEAAPASPPEPGPPCGRHGRRRDPGDEHRRRQSAPRGRSPQCGPAEALPSPWAPAPPWP